MLFCIDIYADTLKIIYNVAILLQYQFTLTVRPNSTGYTITSVLAVRHRRVGAHANTGNIYNFQLLVFRISIRLYSLTYNNNTTP